MLFRKYKCNLTEKGIQYLDGLEDESVVERRIAEFVKKAAEWISKRALKKYSEDDVKDAFNYFLQQHLKEAVDLIFPKSANLPGAEDLKPNTDIDGYLWDYVKETERSDPSSFETLREAVQGSIISIALYGDSASDAAKRFAPTKLFLDTNLVFSLLGLHNDLFNKRAAELNSLIENEKSFELWLFDFTLEEIIRVLKVYPRNRHKYFGGIDVATVYSSMSKKGISESDLLKLIVEIDEHLAKLHIQILSTGSKLKDADKELSPVQNNIFSYKRYQSPFSRYHDLLAIEHVERIRGGSQRKIRDAKAFFLTSDRRLAHYAMVELNHTQQATISEVITDQVLTIMLWLRDPKAVAPLSLSSLIALHSRRLFVERHVWDVFVAKLTDLQSSKKITDEDIGIVIYDQRIQSELAKISPEDASGKLTDEWVLQTAEESKKRLESKQIDEMKGLSAKFAEEMREARNEKQTLMKSVEARASEVAEILAKLREDCSRQAERWAKLFDLIVSLVILEVVIFLMPKVISSWALFHPVSELIGLAVSVFFFFWKKPLNALNMREKVKNRIERSILRSSPVYDKILKSTQ